MLGTTIIAGGKGVAFADAALALIVSTAASYTGYLCHGFVGDRIGRRLAIVNGWLISGVACTLMMFGSDSQAFAFDTYIARVFFIVGPYAALLSSW